MSLWGRVTTWIRRRLYRLNPGEIDALIEDLIAYAGSYPVDLDDDPWRAVRISRQARHEHDREGDR